MAKVSNIISHLGDKAVGAEFCSGSSSRRGPQRELAGGGPACNHLTDPHGAHGLPSRVVWSALSDHTRGLRSCLSRCAVSSRASTIYLLQLAQMIERRSGGAELVVVGGGKVKAEVKGLPLEPNGQYSFMEAPLRFVAAQNYLDSLELLSARRCHFGLADFMPLPVRWWWRPPRQCMPFGTNERVPLCDSCSKSMGPSGAPCTPSWT